MPNGRRSDSFHPQYFQRLAIISTILALAIFAIIWFQPPPRSGPNVPRASAREIVIATPQNFTDVIGRVSTVKQKDAAITLRTMITGSDGKQRSYDYRVAVTPETSMQTTRIHDENLKTTTLELADIHANDTLHVYARDNLYQHPSFQATHIIKLIEE